MDALMSSGAAGCLWKRKARFISYGCASRKRKEMKTRLEYPASSHFGHPACLSLCVNFVSGVNLERMINTYINAFSRWPLPFTKTVLVKGNLVS